MKYENLMILFFLPLVFLGLFLLWFLHRWVCTNSSMDLPVHLLKTIRLQSSLDIFTEMWLVFLGFIFHQGLKNYCKQCQTVILNLHNNRHKKKARYKVIRSWHLPSYRQQYGHQRCIYGEHQHQAPSCPCWNQQTFYHCEEYPDPHQVLPETQHHINQLHNNYRKSPLKGEGGKSKIQLDPIERINYRNRSGIIILEMLN